MTQRSYCNLACVANIWRISELFGAGLRLAPELGGILPARTKQGRSQTMSVTGTMKTLSIAETGRRGVVVKAGAEHRVKQGADYQPGVSAETVGSQVIWLGLMTLPPGARTKAHIHEHHETALYMMSGGALELWTGDELEHCDNVKPGDFIYIPANVLHVAVNRGTTPAAFVGSRNEATAQESLVLRPEMDARVP
jgi:uncharacterized RmlC-like cupin family protein